MVTRIGVGAKFLEDLKQIQMESATWSSTAGRSLRNGEVKAQAKIIYTGSYFYIYMEPKEILEKKVEPIFNPDGPDKEATEELIKALSTALINSTVGNYTRRMIEAVKEGYERQSKQKYSGFLPEL